MELDRTSMDPSSRSPGRRSRAGAVSLESAALPAFQERLAAINALLVAKGSAHRVEGPRGESSDRDRISTQLMRALSETGDRSCFELVYRLNATFVLNFCRARLRGFSYGIDPQDVLEDTFLNIWLKHHRFGHRHDSTFTGWALVVAEHLVLQALRSRRRECERVRSTATCGEPLHHDDPSRRVEVGERNDRLAADWALLVAIAAKSLEGLAPRSRVVLTLRDVEGLSYHEIANRLSVSRSYVGMMIRRGRNRLLEAMHRTLRASDEPPSHPLHPAATRVMKAQGAP